MVTKIKEVVLTKRGFTRKNNKIIMEQLFCVFFVLFASLEFPWKLNHFVFSAEDMYYLNIESTKFHQNKWNVQIAQYRIEMMISTKYQFPLIKF